MSQYVTTNVRLPREDWKQLKQEALKTGISLSEMFRRFTDQHLRGLATQQSLRNNPLLNLDRFGFRSRYKNTSRDLKKIRIQMLLRQNKIHPRKRS